MANKTEVLLSHFSRRKILVLGFAGLSGMTLIGCGGSNTSPSGYSSGSSTGSSSSSSGSSTGSSSSSSSSTGSSSPQAGVVSGRVVDSQGGAVINPRVVVDGISRSSGQVISYEPPVGTDGSYSASVTDGRYHVIAYARPSFLGTQWNLLLDPDDKTGSDQDAANGVVRNFTWKLTGLRPNLDASNPGSYYGAYVIINLQLSSTSNMPDSTNFQITLTPTGALVDGSTGQALTVSKTLADFHVLSNLGQITLVNIPLGPYTLAATANDPNGTNIPLQFDNTTIAFSGQDSDLAINPVTVTMQPATS